MFNRKNISQYKGRLVRIIYRNNGKKFFNHTHDITGEITATTKYKLIVNVNKSGREITLDYEQIKEVKNP